MKHFFLTSIRINLILIKELFFYSFYFSSLLMYNKHFLSGSSFSYAFRYYDIFSEGINCSYITY